MLPRLHLAHLPTPLEPLPHLSAALGPRLWIKRDDQTGLAAGGNKTRKLEFLLAEAQRREADTLLTVGGPQSNHCRQTAAAAARLGLRCVLVLGGHAGQARAGGNLLLDHLLGAEVIWAGERTREAVMDERAEAERAAGRQPYAIPLGGSTALGAAGYALAMAELLEQARAAGVRFDRVVVASSSGGTQAGLVAGARLHGFEGEVLGISIDEERAALQSTVARLAAETAALLGQPHALAPDDISVDANYLGGGYGVMGQPEREAIRLFALTEGILLDPVYTGRAAAGLLDLVRRGTIGRGETVLFWHTGGTPALFAYADELLK
jgi:D-cysteine desulfhydrase family pyridoxal phosphate-dependent enzyme